MKKIDEKAFHHRDTEGTEKKLCALCVSVVTYFTFAHASFSVTVRLKTIASSVESGSTQK